MDSAFLDYGSVDRGDLEPCALQAVLPGIRLYEASDSRQILARTASAEVICTNKALISREVMQGASRLRLIALAATGSNNVDLEAARERGIAVCNTRHYCTASLAQHVWALVLALTHHLREYALLTSGGAWARAAHFTMLDHPVRELGGRNLGIVGAGELGSAVARIGEAFGMRVLLANRPGGERRPGRLDLPELLKVADIISLHCPLTDATRGMIGAAELALMKPDALLINTARGALVDTAALAAALRERRIGGAGIDVLPQEPPVVGNPLLDVSLSNLIVTPHIAWAAREARQRCLDQVTENVQAFLAGRELRRLV